MEKTIDIFSPESLSIMKISELYHKYSIAEGNQHIASEYAIIKLQQLVKTFEIKNILEIGLGIGSICGSLLAMNKNVKYSGTENNSFCLKSLKNNVQNYELLNIFPGIEDLKKNRLFDLIIVDGKDASLENIKRMISSSGIIAIEGDRMEQQKKLLEVFPKSRIVHCISLKKNKDYSPFPPESWQGGIKIIFINPDFKQKLWYLKNKIYTGIKYKFRKIRS